MGRQPVCFPGIPFWGSRVPYRFLWLSPIRLVIFGSCCARPHSCSVFGPPLAACKTQLKISLCEWDLLLLVGEPVAWPAGGRRSEGTGLAWQGEGAGALPDLEACRGAESCWQHHSRPCLSSAPPALALQQGGLEAQPTQQQGGCIPRSHPGTSLAPWGHASGRWAGERGSRHPAAPPPCAILVSKEWTVWAGQSGLCLNPRSAAPQLHDLQADALTFEPVSLSVCFLGNNNCTYLL